MVSWPYRIYLKASIRLPVAKKNDFPESLQSCGRYGDATINARIRYGNSASVGDGCRHQLGIQNCDQTAADGDMVIIGSLYELAIVLSNGTISDPPPYTTSGLATIHALQTTTDRRHIVHKAGRNGRPKCIGLHTLTEDRQNKIKQVESIERCSSIVVVFDRCAFFFLILELDDRHTTSTIAVAVERPAAPLSLRRSVCYSVGFTTHAHQSLNNSLARPPPRLSRSVALATAAVKTGA